MVLDLDCNVLTYMNKSKEHIAIHYAFGDEIKPRASMNKAQNTSALFIERLDSNVQYFNFSLHKELEFMQVKRNTMYVHEFHWDTKDLTKIKDEKALNAFK